MAYKLKNLSFLIIINFQKRNKDILYEAETNNYQIVMTEKDYFKFKDFKRKNQISKALNRKS